MLGVARRALVLLRRDLLRRSITRRQAINLGVAVAGGLGLGHVLTRNRVIGRAIDDPILVSSILKADDALIHGPASASVRLAVFSDYQCPACRKSFPEMEAAVAKDGEVSVIYQDWPIFGPASERAAYVAIATAEQGIYSAVHRKLMRNNRPIDDIMLRDVVTSAGGDWRRVERYITTHRASIAKRLRRNGEHAVSIGLPGTSGYLAQHYVALGALDQGGFAQLFKQAREIS